MDTQARLPETAIDRLLTQVPKDDFFQAVSLLERQLSLLEVETGHKSPCLSYRSSAAMHYPEHLIERIESTKDGKIDVFVSFLGFMGQAGILPECYTELLLARLEENDDALAKFLDIFVHRIVTIFYDIWQQHRFYANNQSVQNKFQSNKLIQLLASLIGRKNIESDSYSLRSLWIAQVGHLSQHAKTKEGIVAMLSAFLKLPVHIKEYKGKWLMLKKNQCSRLQSRTMSFSNNRFGGELCMGRRVWYVQQVFDIHIGPLNYKMFKQLLPDKGLLKQIRRIIEQYIGRERDYVMTLSLKAASVPKNKMTRRRTGQRLGWNYWMGRYRSDAPAIVSISDHLAPIYELLKKENIQ